MTLLAHHYFSKLSAWARTSSGARFRCLAGGIARLAAIIGLASVAHGCFMIDIFERANQLRTYTNMQVITARIEEFRRTGGRSNDPKIAEYLKSEAGGRDQWGHLFLFRSRPAGESFSYVLVSVGRDGKLDTASLDDYFDAPRTRIHGMFSRDIVFRNGAAITNAGK